MSELRAFFEDLAERWDELQPPNRREILRGLLAPFAPLLSGCGDVLEVGTGTGALIPCLRERAPGARVVSIDLAGAMLRRARARCPDAAVVQADVHRPPFAAGGFDMVICHNSFPHFADKTAALKALAELAYLSPRREGLDHLGGFAPLREPLITRLWASVIAATWSSSDQIRRRSEEHGPSPTAAAEKSQLHRKRHPASAPPAGPRAPHRRGRLPVCGPCELPYGKTLQ